MTEEQYTDMFATADILAERVRSLDKPPVMNPTGLNAGPESQDPDTTLPTTKMIEDLSDDHDSLARAMRALVEVADHANDPGMTDHATECAAFHEKAVWMLKVLAA